MDVLESDATILCDSAAGMGLCVCLMTVLCLLNFTADIHANEVEHVRVEEHL